MYIKKNIFGDSRLSAHVPAFSPQQFSRTPRGSVNTKMATKSTMHLAKASEFLSKKEKSLGTKVVENNALLAYLIFYNVSQMLGWSMIMIVITSHICRERELGRLYAEVAQILQIFQTAAILEILHSATGIVKSNPVLTGLQVFSRVFILWGVVWSVPQVQTSSYILCFLLAWTTTEIIRYSFYFFSLLGSVPYFLIWCRYTFFIILYPIGVMGEVMTVYMALPYVKELNLYSVSLPNLANMSFNYSYYLWLVLFSYVPVFPKLYGHMLSQRKKIISDPQLTKKD